jgi:hypothetical protein
VPDDDSIEALRAAVEAIVPALDGRPGGAELGVEQHVAQAIEQAFPGFVDLIAILLDAFARDVRPGATFVQLTLEERGEVFRLMTNGETQDLRDAMDAVLVFTYGGMYSEWTGYRRATRELRPPAVWQRLGYHGPIQGVADYRQAAPAE